MLDIIECKRLLDIAFTACQEGFPGEAREILDGLELALPDSPEVRICRAMSHYVVNEFDAAHVILGDVLAADPGNEIALAHLGVLYKLAHQPDEARKQFELVLVEGTDPQARALSQAMLDEAM
ncbi:tetratricopeptide repeat protein [Desulfocurvus sp. DL9XJH121]